MSSFIIVHSEFSSMFITNFILENIFAIEMIFAFFLCIFIFAKFSEAIQTNYWTKLINCIWKKWRFYSFNWIHSFFYNFSFQSIFEFKLWFETFICTHFKWNCIQIHWNRWLLTHLTVKLKYFDENRNRFRCTVASISEKLVSIGFHLSF